MVVSIFVSVFTRFGEDTRRFHGFFLAESASSQDLAELRELAAEVERNPSTAAEEEFIAAAKRMEGLLKRPVLQDVREGQVWRLVTPIFLHFGPFHILFNMMWLWQLGQVMEERYKTWRFGLLVLFVAVCSTVAQGLAHGPNFGGMSGVIYGLIGFVFACSKVHPNAPLGLNPQVFRFMLLWMVLCMVGVIKPVANYAHVAGLLSGGLAGVLVGLRAGGWDVWKRRQQFHHAVRAGREQTLYRCAVCGRTDQDEGGHLEFRVGADGQDYCLDHLPMASNRKPPPS